ncbi:hypothetical protein DW099_17350 [Emergencia timonensis]|uniref:Uncharacterized protein n=1 Tax=Emergencia timonensis TaxID=1776384 RepID=A0A415DW69_9FIRM|nr:hypothetical protein DW099_17350 [Emergencia timonensis]
MREKNLTGFKGIYPFTHQAPVNIIPYNSLYGNFYSMNPMFAKGVAQVNLKKTRMKAEIWTWAVFCAIMPCFFRNEGVSIYFMRLP